MITQAEGAISRGHLNGSVSPNVEPESYNSYRVAPATYLLSGFLRQEKLILTFEEPQFITTNSQTKECVVRSQSDG
jgi:hypothetical protein